MRTVASAVQRRPSAEQSTCSWTALACGVIGTIATVMATIYVMKEYYEKKSDKPGRLRAASAADQGASSTDEHVRAVIRALEVRTDAEFWGGMARYVRKFGPRPWDEQLLFQELTADLYRYRMTRPWRGTAPKTRWT